MATISGVASAGATWFGRAFALVKFGLLGIFILYAFIVVIIGVVTHHSITYGLKELGTQLLNPLGAADKTALILQSENISFTKSVWKYFGFYFNIYTLFLWLKLFVFLAGWSPFSNESEKFKNLLIGVTFFLFIAVIDSVLFLQQNWNYVFVVFGDIGKAITNVFSNTNFTPNVIPKANNSCVGDTCVI